MAVRVFFSDWWVEDPDGNKIGVLNRPTPAELLPFSSRRIQHPLLQWMEDNEADPVVASVIEMSMHFPDSDSDGLPDQDFVLVFVHVPDVNTAAIENLENTLTNVVLFPPHHLDKTLASMSQGQRNKLFAATDAAGIPRSQYDTAVTILDVLRLSVAYWQSGFTSFGARYEQQLSGAFS